MSEKDYFPVMDTKDCLPPEGTKEGTLHWILGPSWFEERVWIGTGWTQVGHAYVVSPKDAGSCGWQYHGPRPGSVSAPEGVFNFNESFPAPHMIRVRLTKDRAFETLQKLAKMLADDRPVYTLDYFGVLSRDPEEDKGKPIEVGQ
jgi:hypothetical protein